MAAAVISPSLPAMRTEYADVTDVDLLVRLVVTITSAAIAVTAPFAGLVAARVGTRPVLVAGLVLYAAAGTAGLVVGEMVPLLVVRAVLGLAVGAIMTAVSTTIAALWSGDRRARLLGGQQLFASLGGVVFLSLAGWLSTFTWRAPFWIYGVALVLVPLAVTTPLAPSVTVPGPTTSSTQDEPIRAPLVVVIYALALTATGVFFLAPTQLPFAMDRLGLGSSTTGIVVAASTATGVVGSMLFSRLRRRLTPPSVAAFSLGLLAAGWLLIGLTAEIAWTGVLVGALIGGIGVGLIVPDLNLWLSDTTPPPRRGLVLGGLVSAIFAGQFLSPLVAQPLIDHIGIAQTFVVGSLLLIATAALMTVAAIRRDHPSPRASIDAGTI